LLAPERNYGYGSYPSLILRASREFYHLKLKCVQVYGRDWIACLIQPTTTETGGEPSTAYQKLWAGCLFTEIYHQADYASASDVDLTWGAHVVLAWTDCMSPVINRATMPF